MLGDHKTQIPKAVIINKLVFRKFPHISAKAISLNLAARFREIADELSGAHDKKLSIFSEPKGEADLAILYREELGLLTDERLNELYKLEKQEIDDLHNQEIAKIENDLFHQDKMNADYAHWIKADYWTVEECLALTFGKNPNIINYRYVSENRYCEANLGCVMTEFVKRYDKLLNLVERSIESGFLKTIQTYGKALNTEKRRILPLQYISWAQSKSTALPKELEAIASKKIDYQDIAVKAMEANISFQDKCANLEAENKSLKEELKQKEDQRVIKTLYKILCGLIAKHYSDKTSRVSKIQTTLLNEAGIDLDEKTIRTHVEKSLEEDASEKE